MAEDAWAKIRRWTNAGRENERLGFPSGWETAARLRELDKLVARIQDLADEQILIAREAGVPYEMLGSSKQQAQQRWKRVNKRQERLTALAEVRYDANHRFDDDEGAARWAARLGLGDV